MPSKAIFQDKKKSKAFFLLVIQIEACFPYANKARQNYALSRVFDCSFSTSPRSPRIPTVIGATIYDPLAKDDTVQICRFVTLAPNWQSIADRLPSSVRAHTFLWEHWPSSHCHSGDRAIKCIQLTNKRKQRTRRRLAVSIQIPVWHTTAELNLPSAIHNTPTTQYCESQ